MRRYLVLVLLGLMCVASSAQTINTHTPITEDQFYHIIGDRMGSQAYVTVTYKLLPPVVSPNPFTHPSTQPSNLWLVKWVEVGQTTLYGPFPMGTGINFDAALTDLKLRNPYLLPPGDN